MAQNGNNQNPNPVKKLLITFVRIAILAGLAWAIVTGVKMVMGG